MFYGLIHAQTITFDDQGFNANQLIKVDTAIGYFQITSNRVLATNYGFNFDINGISLYNLFSPIDSISIHAGDYVNLQSIAVYQVSETNSDSLLIEGWNGNNKTYYKIFTNLNKWQILTLNYNNINRFVFKSKNVANKNFDYNIDNIVINPVPVIIDTCSIVITVNPLGSGCIAGDIKYAKGSPASIYANPNTGFTFTNWTENGKVLTTNLVYSIDSLNSNRTFVANFTKDLPVELVSFAATEKKGKVTLTWKTATEINNYGYYVQRKTTGNWTNLGFVAGHGTSNKGWTYSFIDTPKRDGDYYYRLEQMDINGNIKFYKTIYIVIGK